jgi:hypothetical protein
MLSIEEVKKIQQNNDLILNRGDSKNYCYSANTVQQLIETIHAINKEKNKWESVAKEKSETMLKISRLTKKYKRGTHSS